VVGRFTPRMSVRYSSSSSLVIIRPEGGGDVVIKATMRSLLVTRWVEDEGRRIEASGGTLHCVDAGPSSKCRMKSYNTKESYLLVHFKIALPVGWMCCIMLLGIISLLTRGHFEYKWKWTHDLTSYSYVVVRRSDGIGIPQSRLEDHARLYNSSRLSQAWIAEAWIL
jgi:hypothetical protein